MTNFSDSLNRTEYISDIPHENSPVYSAVCAFGMLFAFGIIFLNGTVIKALILSKQSQDVSNSVVASLSLADLLTGVVLIHLALNGLIHFHNVFECFIRIGLIYTVSLSSYIHLLAITIDRYIKIVHPFYYFRIFTIKKVMMMSTIIWMFSAVVGFLPLFGWHKPFQLGPQGDIRCLFFGVLPNGFFKLNFVINILIIIFSSLFYGRIIYVARKQHNAIVIQQTGSVLIDKHAWKLAKTIFLVVIVTNLLWLPGVVLIILHMSGGLSHVSIENKGELIAYSGLFAYLNCIINPIIYAAKITSVRRLFQTMFCCTKYDRRNSSNTQEYYEMDG